MCTSSSLSQYRARAAVARIGALPLGGYADGFTAGSSADGGNEDRGFDRAYGLRSPTWCCQSNAALEAPSGGTSLQAACGPVYPAVGDRSERLGAGPVERLIQNNCRKPLRHDGPGVARFMLRRQPACCPCTAQPPKRAILRPGDGVGTGPDRQSCIRHQPATRVCRASSCASAAHLDSQVICNPFGTIGAVVPHRSCRISSRTGRTSKDRSAARRNDLRQAFRPSQSCLLSRRFRASWRERPGRDALHAVRPGRGWFPHSWVAAIQSGNMPARIAVEQRDPCCLRDRRDALAVARSRNAATAAEVKRLPTASRRAACRHWGRKAVSRMGSGTRPRSLGGEPSRLQGGRG